VLVVEAPAAAEAEKPSNAFETLTLAPIDRRLVELSVMTPEEIAWLDSYHTRVVDSLAPLVDEPTRAWLSGACAPLTTN
jgi:Xaa-Pro aminopeptidase